MVNEKLVRQNRVVNLEISAALKTKTIMKHVTHVIREQECVYSTIASVNLRILQLLSVKCTELHTPSIQAELYYTK